MWIAIAEVKADHGDRWLLRATPRKMGGPGPDPIVHSNTGVPRLEHDPKPIRTFGLERDPDLNPGVEDQYAIYDTQSKAFQRFGTESLDSLQITGSRYIQPGAASGFASVPIRCRPHSPCRLP